MAKKCYLYYRSLGHLKEKKLVGLLKAKADVFGVIPRPMVGGGEGGGGGGGGGGIQRKLTLENRRKFGRLRLGLRRPPPVRKRSRQKQCYDLAIVARAPPPPLPSLKKKKKWQVRPSPREHTLPKTSDWLSLNERFMAAAYLYRTTSLRMKKMACTSTAASVTGVLRPLFC